MTARPSEIRPGDCLQNALGAKSGELQRLSDQVSRIASTLAALAHGASIGPVAAEPPSTDDVPAVSPDTIRSVIRARRLRGRFFDDELFADPAWDILLDLMQAELAQIRVTVSDLCVASAVPETTGLRWLNSMLQKGLIVRHRDPLDGRRTFVALTPQSSEALRRYFVEFGLMPKAA